MTSKNTDKCVVILKMDMIIREMLSDLLLLCLRFGWLMHKNYMARVLIIKNICIVFHIKYKIKYNCQQA